MGIHVITDEQLAEFEDEEPTKPYGAAIFISVQTQLNAATSVARLTERLGRERRGTDKPWIESPDVAIPIVFDVDGRAKTKER